MFFDICLHRCMASPEASEMSLHRYIAPPEASEMGLHRCMASPEASGMGLHRCMASPEASEMGLHRYMASPETSEMGLHRFPSLQTVLFSRSLFHGFKNPRLFIFPSLTLSKLLTLGIAQASLALLSLNRNFPDGLFVPRSPFLVTDNVIKYRKRINFL